MQTEARVVESHKRKFIEFLGQEDYETKYTDKIRRSIQDGKYRFILNINELRSSESEFTAQILKRPREYIIALQEAVTETAKNLDPSFEKLLNAKDLQVGFEGCLAPNAVTPRGLNSTLLNKLVQVEGIVVKCSNVRPKLVRSVQYCPTTKEYSMREYRDATSLDIGIEVRENLGERLPTNSTFPTQDANGNPLEVEHGLCLYKDYQTLVLQEMPEKSRVGQLPRSIDVVLEHDLVDRVKPGDRILCTGVYRSLPSQSNGQTSGIFKTLLMCNNVSVIGKEIGAVRVNEEDTRNIKELSQHEDILSLMARSLCPSIYGHEFIKKALILQLLSGTTKQSGETRFRGDINIMMVGDPSTAKSQLLRSVLDIAPLAISTTGRGSSGVGLTAAVTTDPETGEKRLEAGAMVLADRGIVCIDEFDKMNENDRVAIHEVMEQQTVTIAKAGIHAALNARCSVVAAANPVYGQYDKSRRPQDNIGLPDSLLSRFDLLFIVLDQMDPYVDRALSEHVIKCHSYRRPGTTMEPESFTSSYTANLLDDQQSYLLEEDVQQQQLRATPVWLRSGSNSSNTNASRANAREEDLLTKDFLRKYIHYAKTTCQPAITNEAEEVIMTAYANMRAHQTKKNNLPITPRCLDTIIRLSTAVAKSRLSPHILVQDVEQALELLNFVLFHEVGNAQHVSHQQQQSPQQPAQESNNTLQSSTTANAVVAGDENPDNNDEEEEPVHQDNDSLKDAVRNFLVANRTELEAGLPESQFMSRLSAFIRQPISATRLEEIYNLFPAELIVDDADRNVYMC